MAKFLVKPTRTGIKFDLLGAEDAVLVTSEVYAAESACLNGVESVKKNCVGGVEDQTVEGFEALSHPKFEVFVDQGGKFRFHLKAVNGQIVAVSKAYEDKGECLKCIEAVKAAAPDAAVEKE